MTAVRFRWPGGGFGTLVRSKKDEPSDLLYQSQKMESLGRLTGGVAHEFNNLLTVVLGNATALRVAADLRGDLQAVRRAEVIERAAERGGRLAAQLLAFSHKQMLRPQSVSVYQFLSTTNELLAQAAGEAVRLHLTTEPGLWDCRVDPGQLESAVLNLVLNAREAMPTGGILTIRCRNRALRKGEFEKRPSGDYVCVEVTDTGCGIARELLDKVFEPFFTTKPPGQGSGLGLSQVHGFAGQSGGWVDLNSKVGSGTTVCLFLPRERRRKIDLTAQAPAVRTILVIEPDTDQRIATCESLKRGGYRVLEAADGSAALAHLVSPEHIQLLLTEADLPGGVSGTELGRTACQVRSDLGVLVTSKFSKGADTAFELLMKPYQPSDMMRVVEAVLARQAFSLETEELLANVRGSVRALALPVPAYAEEPPGPRHSAIRIGVMPFRTIGSDVDAAFSLGLAEEITAAFSRFRAIMCLAPASVAALADEPTRQTERWQQLDLDYLITGSVRRKGNDIRVLLRLINMRGSGEINWGQRFDALLADALTLQDQIASAIAAQIAPELVIWEGQDAGSRRKVDPTAYDLMLRAIPATYRVDEAGFRKAGLLLERSLAVDSSSAGCHSWLAHWYLFLVGQGWAKDTARAIDRADHLAQQAVILDPSDARAFTVAGHVRAFLHRDAQGALLLHERAIALNPNLAMAWCYSGLAHSYMGKHSEAIARIQRGQSLSPHDPHGFFYDMALEMPYLLTGQYKLAVEAGRRAAALHPRFSSTYKGLLAALGHLAALREAAAARKVLLALEPTFSISSALARSPLLRGEDRHRYAEGLRLAGVPERSGTI